MSTTFGTSSGSKIYFNDEHEMLRRTISRFVDQDVNPYVDQWEAEGQAPLHVLFKKMGDLGLLGIRYDPEYGGQGLDYWFDLVFTEEMGRINATGVITAIGVQTHMATPAIAEHGSEYLKETFLRPAISGDMVGAIGVTEPGAGSDVAGLETRARRDGDHYVINGSKMFITNGCQADFVTTLCRTDEAPGYHSFSLIVVPTDTPGFSVGQKLDKIGLWSSDTALLYFDDVRVPVENLIGREGEGFIYQMQQFQHERFYAIPPSYVGAKRMIDVTVEYIKQRQVFGKPLIARQVLRHRLVDWLTELECLRHLTYHIVRMKEAGLDVTREVSMAKLVAGPLVSKIADGCLQMHGGMGYMTETYVSRFFRDTRLLSIGGGADEVMREILSRLEGF